MTDQISPAPASGPLPMGRVNWTGLKTLYLREVRRFIKVYTQTLVAPLQLMGTLTALIPKGGEEDGERPTSR